MKNLRLCYGSYLTKINRELRVKIFQTAKCHCLFQFSARPRVQRLQERDNCGFRFDFDPHVYTRANTGLKIFVVSFSCFASIVMEKNFFNDLHNFVIS